MRFEPLGHCLGVYPEKVSNGFFHSVTEHILVHNSVDFIGYPRQAYRGFLSLPKGFKKLKCLTSEVVTGY